MGIFGRGKSKDTAYSTSDAMIVGYEGKRVVSIAFTGDGDYETPVAGITYHRDTLDDVIAVLDEDTGGLEEMQAQLLREPSNPHDRNAIRVTLLDQTAGYVPRETAATLAPWIDASGRGLYITCPALIRWNILEREIRSIRLDIAYDAAGRERREAAEAAAEQAAATALASVASGNVQDLWSVAFSPTGDVLGESAHFTHLADLVRRHLGTTDLGGGGSEIDTHALLVPAGDTVVVLIDGGPVGYLAEESADALAGDLAALSAAGSTARVRARAWCNGAIASVQVDVDPAASMIPVNSQPAERFAVLPAGRAIQVTGEEAHLDVLAAALGGAAQRTAWVTLHEVEGKGGKATVEVRLDGQRVGGLSPATAAEILPLVRHLAASGDVAAAAGWIKGSALKADVTFRSAKASEVPSAWLEAHSPLA